MTSSNPLGFLLLLYIMSACTSDASYWAVKQVTHGQQNHELDHNENFSPDDEWVVYDTRPDPAGIQKNSRIEKVHLQSGQAEVLYEAKKPNPFGPGVGAASYHPFLDQVVFLHGLDGASEDLPYAAHRRTGVIVDAQHPGQTIYLDSRNVQEPFLPGALRGGTHRHQWSADGDWIGFTYNDAIMVDLERQTGKPHDLRTVGVAKRTGPSVQVPNADNQEQVQGTWYSVLLVPVVPSPKPGTDEISRAYEDWWVGTHGYRTSEGKLQRARAFLGDLVDGNGKPITEVFVVDIPERIDIPGPLGPLEGTATTLPAPPAGVEVRRLTYTESRQYPGVSSTPRHWVSSSANGSWISYLAKDDAGVVQVFFVSPLGGDPIQATHHHTDVQTMVRWHPTENVFSYGCDNSLFIAEVKADGEVSNPVRIIPKAEYPPFAHCWSRSGDQIAFNRYLPEGEGSYIQVFVAENIR